MKKVITYGTFDLTHIGHIRLLKRAKELWDYLIVWVSSDYFNSLKWKKSHFSFNDRKEILESIKYVDKVIKEDSWSQKEKDIKKYNVDTFVIWDDWEWKFDNLNKICEVIYLKRTKDISTTQIKSKLKNK